MAADTNLGDVTFGGELWTGADGSAVVELASYLRDRPITYSYEVRPLKSGSGVAIAAELAEGRLLIRSAPHLKIEWRITASPGPSGPRHGRA